MDIARSWLGSLQTFGQDFYSYSPWQYTSMSSPSSSPDFSATNPWRDLPSDPSVHATIRELLWISETLSNGLNPTSLPDDDYGVYSAALRSLEMRPDVTYLVLDETDVGKTVMALANRGGTYQPIPEEPFELQERIVALHGYWFGWQSKEDAPNKWEAAAFDTTVIPPLLPSSESSTTTTSDEEEKKKKKPHLSTSTSLTFTEEQAAAAEDLYAVYIQKRSRAVSYLKRHPPTPMGFSPVTQDHASSKEAWESFYPDEQINPNRPADEAKKLFGNVRWKPMYRSLLTERVPFDWMDPDMAEEERAREEAKTEEDWRREMEVMNERHERVMERRGRQEAFQERLKEEMNETQT
jgi:hypothetical protein